MFRSVDNVNSILFSLEALSEVRGKENAENAKSAQLISQSTAERLREAGATSVTSAAVQKGIGVIARMQIGEENLSVATVEARKRALVAAIETETKRRAQGALTLALEAKNVDSIDKLSEAERNSTITAINAMIKKRREAADAQIKSAFSGGKGARAAQQALQTQIISEATATTEKLDGLEKAKLRTVLQAELASRVAKAKTSDEIRAQIFRIEELQRIEDEHGSGAVAVAKGIQGAIDQIKKSWNDLIGTVTRFGNKVSEALGPKRTEALTKFVVVFGVAAAAAGPLLLILAAVAFVITSIVIPAIAGILSIVAAVFFPVILIVGAVLLVLSLLRQEGESLGDTFFRVFGAIGTFISDVFTTGIVPFIQGIASVFIPIVEQLGIVWRNIISNIKLLLGELFGSSEETSTGAATNWKEVGSTVGNVIGAVIFAILKVIEVANFVIGALAKALFVVGGIILDTLLFPFTAVFDLVADLGRVWISLFKGDLQGALIGLGTAIFDFVLSPIRLVLRAIIALADAVNIDIGKGVRIFAEEGTTGLIADALPGKKAAPSASARAALARSKASQEKQRKGEIEFERRSKSGRETKENREGILETLKRQLKENMDFKTQAAAEAKDPPKVKALINLTDNRTVELDASLCVDSDEMAVAGARKKQELQERAGFKATPWQRRQMLEQGSSPKTGTA